MKIKPLADRVVVKPVEVEEINEQRHYPRRFRTGEAPGCHSSCRYPGGLVDGKEVEMYVKVGDRVITGKYSGTEVKLDKEEYTP